MSVVLILTLVLWGGLPTSHRLVHAMSPQPQGRSSQPKPISPIPACVAGSACCPWPAGRDFCRVGCPPPHPASVFRFAPDTKALKRPHPTGVAILELAIDKEGHVISACVLRSLRPDFDKAAQAAALKSLWKPQLLRGQPVGAFVTVSFEMPTGRLVRRPPSFPMATLCGPSLAQCGWRSSRWRPS